MGFPLEFCNGDKKQEAEMMRLPASRKKCDDMFIRFVTAPVFDGQTDAQNWYSISRSACIACVLAREIKIKITVCEFCMCKQNLQ